ncbi:MAG: TolC family protein [Candidatus Omnitrophica bacterium]|nr:TolC family protein [Candidatus Omnitrophota bacterium]
MKHISIGKICQQILLVCGSVLLFISMCYAQQPAKLRTFLLKKIDGGLQIHIEHSKPPVEFTVVESQNPRGLIVNFIGSNITFKNYENIPIEVPVAEEGIKRVVVEEKTDYNKVPSERVQVLIELDRTFKYNVDSQWNAQFLDLFVFPGEPDKRSQWTEKEKELGPRKAMVRIKEFKKIEARKAKEHLDKFTRIKRVELIKKESKEKISQLRKNAEKRMESGVEVEKAYKKLNAETSISSLPEARQQIVEKNLYKDISMPSEVKPMILKATPGDKIVRLEDCLSLALAAHLPLQVAKDQQELANLRVREARRGFYPALMGEWNETDGRTVTENYRGRSYALQGEQMLFSGGKLTATLRKEQLGGLIAKGNYERVKNELILKVTKAYYELIMAKNTIDIMQRLKEKSEQVLEEVESEFTVFWATPADLLDAQASYNQVCYQVSYSERGFAMAKLSLEKEMFLENIDITNMDFQLGRQKIETNLTECLDLAFLHRVEIKIIEQTLKAAKFSQDIIKSEEMPNVSIVGSYGRAGESFSQRSLNLATEWSLMGKIRWFLGGNTVETSYKKDKITPFRVTSTSTNVESQTLNSKFSFWDNLAHFTKAKEAQITRKQALKDKAEMKNKIRQETEDAYYTYLRYNTQLSLAVNQIGFRRKQLEILKTKRRMGEARGADVINAETQLAEANGTMQEALAGINIAIVSLNHAIGVINYFN